MCVCVCVSMREGGKLEKVTKEGRVWAACVSVIACSHPGVHKKILVNLFFGPMGFLGSSSMSLCVYFILVIMQGTKSRVSMFL